MGEPRDAHGMALVRVDPSLHPDSVAAVELELPEAEGRETILHGPWWSLEGDRAAVQVLSQDHKDLWIALLEVETGELEVVHHDHDPAWIEGPPIQGGRLQPALLEWLPGGRLAFASERSGWSHLYLMEADGTIRPLTEGEWEVRGAELSRDRSRWLVQGSREHPADDHLPDLFLRDAGGGGEEVRVTVSGSERFHAHRLVRPEIVSFPHPDGDPVWAALYLPKEPNPEGAAVLHLHGGGYRQFAHRGWSVYGFAAHVGFMHWRLEQGYTVLDLD